MSGVGVFTCTKVMAKVTDEAIPSMTTILSVAVHAKAVLSRLVVGAGDPPTFSCLRNIRVC